MSDNNIKSISDGHKDSQSEMEALSAQFSDFKKFVARRFDEISMEINATSQLLDMAEDGAEKRFDNMLGALHKITKFTGGSTAANSGAELEAAIVESEIAANKILDASDKISTLIQNKRTEGTDEKTAAFMLEIDSQIQQILLACSFQDLVGQRIRKATEALRGVEDELSQTLSSLGLTPAHNEDNKTDSKSKDDDFGTDHSSQDDIDALFD